MYGTLSDAAVIEKAAAEADIVIRKFTVYQREGHSSGGMQPGGQTRPSIHGAELIVRADTADSADDVPSATAIAKGLAAGHTTEKPGYWLHVCGTGLLLWVRTLIR